MYPNNTQGQHGLEKCLDALKRISVIWPSASRAAEMFTEVKAQLKRLSDVAGSLRRIVPEPRSKHVTKVPVYMNAETVTEPSRDISPYAHRELVSPPYSVLQVQDQTPDQGLGPSGCQPPHSSHAEERYSQAPDIPPQSPGSSDAYVVPSSYNCWTTDSPATLSSVPASMSVLLQTYATELVNERGLGSYMEQDSQSAGCAPYGGGYSTGHGQVRGMPGNTDDMAPHRYSSAARFDGWKRDYGAR